MADINALAAALNDAANRAALCRDIGDYFGATHWEGRCREIDDAMLMNERRERALRLGVDAPKVKWPRDDR